MTNIIPYTNNEDMLSVDVLRFSVGEMLHYMVTSIDIHTQNIRLTQYNNNKNAIEIIRQDDYYKLGINIHGRLDKSYVISSNDLKSNINDVAISYGKLDMPDGVVSIIDDPDTGNILPCLCQYNMAYAYILDIKPTIKIFFDFNPLSTFNEVYINKSGLVLMPLQAIINVLESNIGTLCDPLAIEEHKYFSKVTKTLTLTLNDT